MLSERKAIDLRKFRLFIQKNNSYPSNIPNISLCHNFFSHSKSSSNLVAVDDKLLKNLSDSSVERKQKIKSKTEKNEKILFTHTILNKNTKKQVLGNNEGNQKNNLNQSFNQSVLRNFFLGQMGNMKYNPKRDNKIQLKNYSFRSLYLKNIENRNLDFSSMNQTVFDNIPVNKKSEEKRNQSTCISSANKKMHYHVSKQSDEIENEEEIHFLFVKLSQKKKKFYSNLSIDTKLLGKNLIYNEYYVS